MKHMTKAAAGLLAGCLLTGILYTAFPADALQENPTGSVTVTVYDEETGADELSCIEDCKTRYAGADLQKDPQTREYLQGARCYGGACAGVCGGRGTA